MQIFSIDCDTPDTNQRFAATGRYPWPILSDADKKVARAFGVLGMMGLPHRWTYFIDPQGVVRMVDRNVTPTDYGKTLVGQLAALGVPR